mmetsp:Transcript_108462/g.187405  ORF Transcript_108462/g.187405 Transcript_108462/m.187405 type:complete len:93 (+) Transcript_108462:236-514(+)
MGCWDMDWAYEDLPADLTADKVCMGGVPNLLGFQNTEGTSPDPGPTLSPVMNTWTDHKVSGSDCRYATGRPRSGGDTLCPSHGQVTGHQTRM